VRPRRAREHSGADEEGAAPSIGRDSDEHVPHPDVPIWRGECIGEGVVRSARCVVETAAKSAD